MAEAVACISDNQGRQVGYGDAVAMTGDSHKDMLQALAQVSNDRQARALSAQLDASGASYLPVPGWGGYLHQAPRQKEETTPFYGWKELPLVGHILKRFPAAARCKVDKVVRRDEKSYFLFEPCSCDSHRHHDTGAILAYEYGKHFWLVDNGYGFDVRNTPVNMMQAYSSREIGPHCHNTLIFRDGEGKIVYPPEFSVYRRRGDVLECEITLPGCVWTRQIKVLARGLEVIDDVSCTGKTDIASVECQFNALGDAGLAKGIWHLEQKEGGRAELRFKDSAKTKVIESSYLTKGWESAMKKHYTLAQGDVKQLRRIASFPAEGGKMTFSSVFNVSSVCEEV